MNQAERLFEQYGNYVRSVAWKHAGCLQAADHRSAANAALVALWDCAKRFDPRRGFSFKTFMLPRVIGAMKDDQRRLDWAPRMERVNKNGNFKKQTPISLLTRAEEDTMAQIADKTWPVETTNVEHLLALIPSGRQRDCIRLYCLAGLTMKEIGTRWGISDSRVGQIYRKAIIGARRKCGLSGPIPKIFKNKYQLKTGGRNGRDHRTQRAGQGQSRQAA
jgi:RNA polymerase sigma factor (sigma-70 family)